MKSTLVLALLSALLSSLVAAADTENYNVFSQVAAEGGAQLDLRRRYAFYEYWHATNKAEECITGFSHVRLVVGKVYTDQVTRDRDFRAESFDMTKSPEGGTGGSAGSIHGNAAYPNHEANWLANQYFQDGSWHRVSTDNKYQWAGAVRTGVDNNDVQHVGAEYIRQYPTYDIAFNNCWNYASHVYDGIKG